MTAPGCTAPALKERLVELVGREVETPLLAELRGHVNECDSCARELSELREAWALLESTPASPSAEVLARARALPARVVRPRFAITGSLGLVASVAVLAALGAPSRNFTALPILSSLFLVAAYALGLHASSTGSSRFRTLFCALAIPGLALSVLSQPGGQVDGEICIPLGSLISLAALGVTAIEVVRGRASTIDGLFWGASVGVLGAALFRLHCPWHGYPHALLYHCSLVPIWACVGALLARLFYNKIPFKTTLATEK